jgi:hypothetical protein
LDGNPETHMWSKRRLSSWLWSLRRGRELCVPPALPTHIPASCHPGPGEPRQTREAHTGGQAATWNPGGGWEGVIAPSTPPGRGLEAHSELPTSSERVFTVSFVHCLCLNTVQLFSFTILLSYQIARPASSQTVFPYVPFTLEETEAQGGG